MNAEFLRDTVGIKVEEIFGRFCDEDECESEIWREEVVQLFMYCIDARDEWKEHFISEKYYSISREDLEREKAVVVGYLKNRMIYIPELGKYVVMSDSQVSDLVFYAKNRRI